MSTKEEQIALLNAEKQVNTDSIDLLNTQLKDLDQAIIDLLNTQLKDLDQAINDNSKVVEGYKTQMELYNADIARLTTNNATLDDIIKEIGG